VGAHLGQQHAALLQLGHGSGVDCWVLHARSLVADPEV
jgi:hypothetical protein